MKALHKWPVRLEGKLKELWQECKWEIVKTSKKVMEHIKGKMGIITKEQDKKVQKMQE